MKFIMLLLLLNSSVAFASEAFNCGNRVHLFFEDSWMSSIFSERIRLGKPWRSYSFYDLSNIQSNTGSELIQRIQRVTALGADVSGDLSYVLPEQNFVRLQKNLQIYHTGSMFLYIERSLYDGSKNEGSVVYISNINGAKQTSVREFNRFDDINSRYQYDNLQGHDQIQVEIYNCKRK